MESTQRYRFLCSVLIALAILLAGETLYAQDAPVTIQLLNGKDGKPFAKHRLVVFFGATALDAKVHKGNIVVTTDEVGIATLSGIGSDAKWIQILPDWLTLCQQEIRPDVYALKDLLNKGARTCNSCSELTKDVLAGRLTIFVRPMTFSEKVKR